MTEDPYDVLERCQNCEELVLGDELKPTEDDVLLCQKCWLVLVEGQKEIAFPKEDA